MRFTSLSPEGLARFLESAAASTVEELDLGLCSIGDEGARRLAESTSLGRLRRLVLGSYGMGARGLCARNQITSEGAAALARSRTLSSLEWLGLPIYEASAELNRALVTSPLARFLYLYPGALEATTESPDGRSRAQFKNPHELWGDGPNQGEWHLDSGLVVPGASPSAVWSSDSQHLAVPRWQQTRGQHQGQASLWVIDLASGAQHELEGSWNTPALFAFSDGVISGLTPADGGEVFTARVSPRGKTKR